MEPLLYVAALIALIVTPMVMAQNRNRSAFIWFLLTLWATPVVTIPVLLLIGDKK